MRVVDDLQKLKQQGLERGSRTAFLGLWINAVLALIKMAAGILGHSYALVADGVESTLDIFGSLVVVSGLRVAVAPADREHPYGHGKAEPLAALMVSLGLIFAALALGIGSVRELFQPHRLPAPFTLLVLLLVVVVKEILFRYERRVGDETGSNAVRADAWHHRSDAITSVAAFLGISIALLGGPGYEKADAVAALLACVIIAFNGVRLLRPALGELMDAAPDAELLSAIRTSAALIPDVLEIDKCHVRKSGLDLFVDLHVRVPGALSVLEGHRIAHRVKDSVRQANPSVVDVLVHIEPERDERVGRSKGL